ncbi:universal stress protein [Stappia stellulata]|uniref:universal stress protein n=1 Tax=Stappia stellulata TaxID=71235 RepID=UPI0004155694|nr:universal stress protein [Stappia stellulata]
MSALFKHVLACVDLGDVASSRQVVLAAREIMSPESVLHIFTAVPDFGRSIVGSFFPDDFETTAIDKTREELHGFIDEQVPDGIRVQAVIGHGNIYEEIIEAAEKVQADLIVIGSHRPELKDYLLGPNAARVVRHAPVSVLVVRKT